MLDSLRRGAQTLVAKILLGLLVASFAVWGISGSITSMSTDSIASVGDTDIRIADFQRAYQFETQAIVRQLGQPLTPSQAAAFGIPQRVLGRMMSEAALTDAANAFGIGISDERLAAEIAADPSLQRDGKFDRAYFSQLLRSNNLNEASYIEERREAERRGQLVDGLFGGIKAPAALTEAVVSYGSEVRDVDYVRITAANVGTIAPPDDATLATWFETRKGDFRAPEYRSATVMTLTPEAIADPAAITPEQVTAEYERNKASYGKPERRLVQRILFPNADEARAALDRINGGMTFDALAAERGLADADYDLGTVAKADVVDPAIADAAFALAAPGMSEPVETRFGAALVRVVAIEPESVAPLAEIEPQIRAELAAAEARRVAGEMQQDIEDALAGGATLAEVAAQFKLTTTPLPEMDSTGAGTDGQPVAGLPQAQTFLTDLFQSDVGVENAPLQVGRDGTAWFEVTKVTPGRDRSLDEVRAQAVAAWTAEEAARKVDVSAEAIFRAVKGGADFAAEAAKAGLTVETSPKFTRRSADTAIGPDAQEAAFGGPEGFVAMSAGPDESRIVLKVRNAVPIPYFAESSDAIEAQTKLSEEMENGVLAQYIDHLQTTLGSSVNQQTLQAILGTSGG
ncbi:peptidylprolyl isomerase [Methylobrevis pamukkalensis]|uniref:Parvulin-like PPIase n=1 Tax=Methylobrevis pamukkalensis TaxID=1439726 RepID=A0A1E3GZM8_9HYPH|nr:peptidylprolyl isomerase [Methylobrevis pamukkalensis]ODN68781.1 Peptidyl-prolyl cis-trans isomerase D [Methylobrevis pamukkalensis]